MKEIKYGFVLILQKLCNDCSLSSAVVSCSILADPTNGEVQYNPAQTFMSLAEFRCNTGYQLTGPASLTCTADGEWSDSPPQCEGESSDFISLYT